MGPDGLNWAPEGKGGSTDTLPVEAEQTWDADLGGGVLSAWGLRREQE